MTLLKAVFGTEHGCYNSEHMASLPICTKPAQTKDFKGLGRIRL